MYILDFEKPYLEIEDQIRGLETLGMQIPLKKKDKDELDRLNNKKEKLLLQIYKNLSPWQKVMVARHPERPKTCDYIARLIDRWVPLAGDRCFGEDRAISTGMGFFRGMPVIIMGHERGKDTESRLEHNFGMAHPEGYRKVYRLLELADRFGFPVLFFVDTPGAYAGIGAEERGQAQAIAQCLERSFQVKSPIISVVIGEGGSGGAVAMATANVILMLQHSVYSVISPEGCASILWRSAEKRQEAALAQKLTAQDLKNLRLIDEIIPEPLGGAHRSPLATVDAIGEKIAVYLGKKKDLSLTHRREKFLAMGRQFLTS